MPVYLDHAASGPLHREALEAMLPWIGENFGNPSGVHQVARRARTALEEGRDVLAGFLGVEPGGVVFTSGGTEADNLAVLGSLALRPGPVVVSAVEHPAVMEAALASGQEVRIAPVDTLGRIDADRLVGVLDRTVSLVSLQLANHETGVVQKLSELATLVRRKAPNARVHTDAVAAAVWLDVAEAASAADLISISGHKFGGPQGVGALGVRGQLPLAPILHGGGQERERRSGTQNVAGAVGMAAAAQTVCRRRVEWSAGVLDLRDALSASLRQSIPDLVETASGAARLPGHLHVRIPGVESEALLILLDEAGVCASAGSACASGAMEPSPILLAMGVAKDDALSSLRLTLSPSTTRGEVEEAGAAIVSAVRRLRGA